MNWSAQLNHLGQKRIPCAFFIDFKGEGAMIFPLKELEKNNIQLQFPDFSTSTQLFESHKIILKPNPISFEEYLAVFNQILYHLNRGDSYLTNLTFSTPIDINTGLKGIYNQSKAKYKILFKDDWVCFSPETFITIRENRITAFPMKGTIDASIPEAAIKLKNNIKERAEHHTIVDLLRNDLSISAKNVMVNRLMYIEKIKTNKGDILQMSSEISGIMRKDWQDEMGLIIKKMLPAGSVSGAPKKKTIEIIESFEPHKRGYYTGIAGVFDGEQLDSCVLIRFIENTAEGMVYKSGGGITAMSMPEEEYSELISKIYVPIH